jgi:hypothetical protein
MATTNDPTPAPAPDQPKEQKSLFDKLFAVTPVVLTIVATLLAGLSTSEFTKGQYWRTVAGQDQSKVGDQWGFFQAKKIRGTNLETAVDLLPVVGRPGPLSADIVNSEAARVVLLLNESEKRASALENDADKKVSSAAKSYVDVFKKSRLENFQKDLDKTLYDKKTQDAFKYLGTDELPKPGDLSSIPDKDKREKAEALKKEMDDNYKKALGDDPDLAAKVKDKSYVHPRDANLQATIKVVLMHQPASQVSALLEAIKAIKERRNDEEINKIVLTIKPKTIEEAIEAAEQLGPEMDTVSGPVEDVVKSLNKAASLPVRLASQYHRLVGTVSRSAIGDSGGSPALKDSLKSLAHLDTPLQTATNDLSLLLKGTQMDYNARRYGAESRINQNTAMMYEVRVHRASAESDAHRRRGGFFFYGMLGAQAGVAISTIALSAKKKGLLWSIATAAGLCAISFSVFVFLRF